MTPGEMTGCFSSFRLRVTADRFAAMASGRGMHVLARIDYAAARAYLDLLPTESLIFDDARAATPSMRAAQTLGIDLPLRARDWEDLEGPT